jgi:hypothetical protein
VTAAVTWANIMDALAGVSSTSAFVDHTGVSWAISGELPIVLMTWAGTGSAMDNTGWPQPAAVAQAAAAAFPNVFTWQPVGNYPASILNPNMGASALDGKNEGVRLATDVWPNNLIIPIGYSQGAICGSWWWRDFILANGLQARVPAALMWGNPLRSPGYANGNAYAGWGMPGLRDGQVTGGISGPDCLTPAQTPSNWLDFVWLGTDGGATELYTNAPIGTDPWTAETEVGHDETLIYNIIVSQDFGGTIEGLVALIEAAVEQFVNPITMVIAMAEAIWNGLQFVAAGPSADHYAYDITPMINYLTQVVAPQFA